MTWERKKVLVVVKAYPEKSTKYNNHLVCTAGITDEGDWIRLYPITVNKFIGGKKIKKFYWIDVECQKATNEKLKRKESYRVREDSIRIIDTSLTDPKANWTERHNIIQQNISKSIESLYEAYRDDRTSLGMIKPKEILEFYHNNELKIYPKSNNYQEMFDGSRIPIFEKIPHIFKYKFKCGGCQETKKSHDIQCEDWELMESYRSWGPRYQSTDILWQKLHQKYYENMLRKHDLYFVMGMYSQYPTWMIIGLYYPPKNVTEKIENGNLTLNRWM
jgi:hypothetical protein